jgi:hypothetical protein
MQVAKLPTRLMLQLVNKTQIVVAAHSHASGCEALRHASQ